MYWVQLVDKYGEPIRKVFPFTTYRQAWDYLEGWNIGTGYGTITRE